MKIIIAGCGKAVSCVNNICPAYGVAAGGYYMYNWFSRLILSFAMLIGRLEIYPILLTFALPLGFASNLTVSFTQASVCVFFELIFFTFIDSFFG